MKYMKFSRIKIGFVASFIVGTWIVPAQVFAQSSGGIESAIGLFRDETRDVSVFSVAGDGSGKVLSDGEGRSSGIRLGYTGKFSTLKDKESLLVKEQLDGKTSMREDSLSVSFDQGLRVGTTMSAFTGTTRSPIGKSAWYGLKLGEWWLEETLQTTLEVRKTDSTTEPVDYTDVDNYRVRTPEQTAGQNISIGAMSLTTPTTILRGNISRTTRSDRPAASAVTGEIRQFVTATDSAIHFAAGHYENIGTVTTKTTYGEVVSNSLKIEWHQNLDDLRILSLGYRYYLEDEDPRAEISARKSLGTDSVYGSFRQRFGDGPRAAAKDEVYFFGGRFSTSESSTTTFFGVGGRKQI